MKKYLQWFIGFFKCVLSGVKSQKKCYLGLNVKIYNKGQIELGKNVKVRPGTGLYCNKNCSLILSDNCEIGRDSTIASHNKVFLGKGVLTGPHVFISDHNHEYQNIDVPIYKQGVRMFPGDSIFIDEGSWLGTNVVIVGNVHIGKNCVIGANSVVTKDIPDFCVAVGIPARIVKKYNQTTKIWERV